MKREYKNLVEDKPLLTLKTSDIVRILGYCRGRKEEVLVHLQVLHGLRISEAFAIRYEDIDFINNRITVKNQTSKGKLVPVKTKNSQRSVPLQPQTREILQNSPNAMTGGFVCKDSNGGPLRYSNYLNRFFKPMMQELGLKFTTHNLRTFFASWYLVERKADVVTVSKWMGHSSPTVTMNIYAKTIEESENRYANLIGNALMPDDRAA
ncbi:site-specific integrase [Dehalococcoidia bacterium]|nr:site-specific integrase [Dehalococcoidia bacterium]